MDFWWGLWEFRNSFGQTFHGTPHGNFHENFRQACSDASHDTPRATFCCVSKSRFSDVSGTLHQGPWGPGEVQTIFFFKIFDWLDQTLPMTPHTPPFAAFQRSRFWEVLGTFRRGPLRPGEVETEFFFQNL